ncbi:MAG: flagellar hook-associated protein FlgK [Bacteroidales bacterium]|nr:flagellar hook-associated protein FlgK [Clostridium sp.]MCM1203826.1 flagellar hook-associated protein FlgK [Bacteroidales bacterium]
MPSTFLGLNTGLSGLNYYQAALNTTGHNISNADTPGYSRQKVSSQASPAIRVRTAYGMMGTGVQTTGIEQLRNVYYDTKFRSAISKSQEYDAVEEQLKQLQAYLNEMLSESGYTKLFTGVSNTLQDLASSPSDATYRTQFLQTMNNFTDLIKETGTNYQNTQQDINNEIAIHVDTINSISTQIFTLNQQIINIETRKGNANDLRDQRELLVDQLSELVNVKVTETPILYGTGKDAVDSGASRYEVRIGNALLVDEMQCRQLTVVAREEKINQNDIDGLYDVYWKGLNDSIGEKFDFNSSNVTGRMKGLLEVRDGNNMNAFSGTITDITTGGTGGTTAAIRLSEAIAVDKLNLPQKGTITLNGKSYYYESWEAKRDADGKLNDFTFKNLTEDDGTGKRVSAIPDAASLGKVGILGTNIDCKGIPYYMTELNEFVRTFSKYMNDIFTDPDGADANGDEGMDFFTAPDVYGKDYVLKTDTGTGNLSSEESNYYQLTALNWSVNQDIMKDQRKLVVSYKKDIVKGDLEAKGLLDKVIYGITDRNMYAQGTPVQFMQSITTSLAVDVSKYQSFCKNMDEVATIIDRQRQSISSVDTNEEASSLVIFQNGYDLSCKIISVMNEVYDKLINQTGI